jgi:simple sugar transport system ATP-binding protein
MSIAPASPSRRPLIRVAGLTKTYGGVRALSGVDFDIFPGEIHCLAGENGSGKSTLVKILSGVTAPDVGSVVEFDGDPVGHLTPAAAKAKGVEVIFQDLSLFPNLSVAENISFSENLGLVGVTSGRHIRQIAARVVSHLGFRLDLDEPVGKLPVAQRQLVAICRGLVANTRFLVLDEPTASLTRVEVDRLLDVVMRLRTEGIAILFVSHRLDEVIKIADRVTVLRDGSKVGTFPAAGLNGHKLAEYMTGLALDFPVVARDMSKAPTAIHVRDLTRLGEYAHINLHVQQGEVVGLIGLLGSGRTELALSLFGMTRPDSGVIEIADDAVAFASPKAAIESGIAYVPEDRLEHGLVMRQSVESNIVLAVLHRLSGALGGLFSARPRTEARRWIEALSIKAPSAEAPVSQLSGGNQQRVVLAKWLALEPKILILDSPTVGVDIGNKKGIYDIVKELARKNISVLLISDEPSEIFATCDRVYHTAHGSIVGEFVPGVITEAFLNDVVQSR